LSQRPTTARPPAPVVLVLASLALVLASTPAAADRDVEHERARHAQLVAAKQLAVELMRQGADRALADARLEAREPRTSARRGHAIAPRTAVRGAAVRGERDATPLPQDARATHAPLRRAARDGLVSPAGAAPIDMRLNDPGADAPNAAQCEPSIAAAGRFALAVWNDGQGFVSGGDTQGYAWSNDDGTNWHRGGAPPHPSGWRWTSDPVLAVDERSGEFWLAALVITDGGMNGVAVARARVSDTGVAWDPAVMARGESNALAFVDKPWIARDPVNGMLFVTHTCFRAGTDEIDLTRSSDDGRTWSAPLTLSSAADAGLVQGARVAVGDEGAVIVVWSAIGPDTDPDFLRARVSRERGIRFGAETTPAAFIANFGTGAPGFNRERGVHYPALAVDRTGGPHHGRIYLGWSESYDFYDDVFPDPSLAPGASEVEPNDRPCTATPFTPGATLRGATTSLLPLDLDHWVVALAAGDRLVVWADSLPARATYTLRLFAPSPDSAQRLCYGGDVTPGPTVTATFYTFVAPVAGDYTLRFSPAYAETTSKLGGYRIRTLAGVAGPERGRDQRDVFVTWSDDGVSWATPVRANDDPVGYDDFLPEIAVAGDGRPYLSWFDFRDDASGSRTEQAIARSDDGGVHWSANARLAGAPGDFTAAASNLAPDMGDYAALVACDGTLWAAWADARDASVDVWGAVIPAGLDLSGWPAVAHGEPGTLLPMSLVLAERSPLFGEDVQVTLTDSRGWPMPASVAGDLAPRGTVAIPLALAVPTDATGADTVTLTARDASGAARLVRTMVLDTGASAPAGAAFALGEPSPSPFTGLTRLSFQLPSAAEAKLEVFGLRGERVRTIAATIFAAGDHALAWDGRDDTGHDARAGLYFVRLESGGRVAVRRVVRL